MSHDLRHHPRRRAVEYTRKLGIDTLTEDQLDVLEGVLKATVLQLDAQKDEGADEAVWAWKPNSGT